MPHTLARRRRSRSRLSLALVGIVHVGLIVGVAVAQDVPDRAEVRKLVDAVVAEAPAHRATLGRLQAAAALSIEFGAPAWNAGDHRACSQFYVQTAQSLCDAFVTPEQATPIARGILLDLKAALDRVKTSTDADANAWTIRFVFDKTEVVVAVEIERSLRLQALGEECMKRSQFHDAANAFADATACLREFEGQPSELIPPACRYAPLALSDAWFGAKDYARSAAALEEGLRSVPEWPVADLDLRQHFADPAVYKLLYERLHDAAQQHPNDAAIQLLDGYHLLATGQRDAARPVLEQALKLSPASAGAKRLLEEYDPTRPKRPAPPVDPKSPGIGV